MGPKLRRQLSTVFAVVMVTARMVVIKAKVSPRAMASAMWASAADQATAAVTSNGQNHGVRLRFSSPEMCMGWPSGAPTAEGRAFFSVKAKSPV